jgi:hypothetical protein
MPGTGVFGAGRPSKTNAINRNRPAADTLTLPLDPPRRRTPKPFIPVGVTWGGPETTAWKALWRTSESTQWSEADVPALSRLVVLQCNRESWDDAKLLAEMRNIEDRMGMNPHARRVLKWVRQAVEPEAEKPEGTSVRRLRAIDPTAAGSAS